MRRTLPLVLSALAFAVIAIVWIVSDRRASQRVYDRYSTSNTSDEGLSLAYGYLGKQRKVAQMTRPFGREPIERNATLFRLADSLQVFFDVDALEDEEVGPPKPGPRRLLNDAEEAFMRAGGRIVLAVTTGALPSGVVKELKATKVFPVWPAVNAFELYENSGGYTWLPPRMHALFIAGDYVIVARQRVGDGEWYLLSAPEALKNDVIQHNLALLEGLAGERRPVYFDEVIHGIVSGDGALELMKEWNLGPFLAMLALAAALVFWRAGKRIGHADDEYRETRSEAVDLVRSLGALYQEVTPESEALLLYHDALTRTVAHTTGVRGDALHKRIDELTGGKRTLQAINEGFRTLESHGRRGSETQSRRVSESPREAATKPL